MHHAGVWSELCLLHLCMRMVAQYCAVCICRPTCRPPSTESPRRMRPHEKRMGCHRCDMQAVCCGGGCASVRLQSTCTSMKLQAACVSVSAQAGVTRDRAVVGVLPSEVAAVASYWGCVETSRCLALSSLCVVLHEIALDCACRTV